MDNNDIYREEIMEHYRNPQNFGVMKNPTYEAEAVNPLCGDKIRLQLKVNKKGVVEKVRFSGSGCALSVASSSQFTEWMVGKTVKKLKSTGPDQIQELMRAKIGPARLPCMLLSLYALQKAVAGE
ncbi:MAG: iron-sulfur cluster assembly scaffold protein [bacterium]|nr:iron-sulfur cluster assembly scaffold protein [bacterium]